MVSSLDPTISLIRFKGRLEEQNELARDVRPYVSVLSVALVATPTRSSRQHFI